MLTFPFGQPVLPCQPSASGQRPLFVLGAYPSALHVKWKPPPGSGARPVRALAVDNEPEPFWDGKDEVDRVEAWRRRVGWSEKWGRAEPAAGLNGPSGDWVATNILGRLGYDRTDAWITDCLDTYRASTGMTNVVESVYGPFAADRGLPAAKLAAHPSEGQIVGESIAEQLPRLRQEIETAQPKVIVTLGNAALRVLAALMDSAPSLTKLSVDSYGEPRDISVEITEMQWYPAAPAHYQQAHTSWRPLGRD